MSNYIQSFVLTKIKKPLNYFELKFPSLQQGQVLVKILFSGICRSQIMEKNGLRGKDKWLPHLLGHEGSGEVIKIGKGVKKIKIGDQVILTWIKCKGKNSKNPKYFSISNKKINSGKVTTFSNYAVVSENRIVKKPKSMPIKFAPFFGCAIPTGAGIVLNQIKPNKNDTVLVLGLGGIGLSSIMALKAIDVKKIIAVDVNIQKLKLAKKIGASKTILFNKKTLKEKIKNFCNSDKVDYCIESAGLSSTIELGISLIKNKGKIVFASHPANGEEIKVKPYDLICGKKIEGSWGGDTKPDSDIKKIFKLFIKKKIKYKLIGKIEYKLKNINKAIKDLETGKVTRPIIKMVH